jgi:hypothetical protein
MAVRAKMKIHYVHTPPLYREDAKTNLRCFATTFLVAGIALASKDMGTHQQFFLKTPLIY